jgi:thiol:disulfide interchange protein DsbC
MKKLLIALFALTLSPSIVKAVEIDPQLQSALRSFKALTRLEVKGVSRTPTTGMFALYTNNGPMLINHTGQLLYSKEQSFHADVKGAITGKKHLEIRAEALSEINEDNVIVIKKGSGSKRVVVNTALDCPYCLKQEKLLAAQDNLDVTLLLVPSVLDKQNWPILEKVMCSADRAAAWHDYMLNQVIPKNSGKCYWSDNFSFLGQGLYSSNVLLTVGTPQMIYGDGRVQTFTAQAPLGLAPTYGKQVKNIFNPQNIKTAYFSDETYVPKKKLFNW